MKIRKLNAHKDILEVLSEQRAEAVGLLYEPNDYADYEDGYNNGLRVALDNIDELISMILYDNDRTREQLESIFEMYELDDDDDE
jgi:hypothetical protein